MSRWLDNWYNSNVKRAEYFDQLARIREEAEDPEGAQSARDTAASLRPSGG